MAGLDPAIHLRLNFLREQMDHRVKPGDDDQSIVKPSTA
jgi:hypothetical protein